MPKYSSNVRIFYFVTRAYLFSPDEGSWYIFSTRNNCCEFPASYGVIIQSVIQSFSKMPVFDASLSFLFLTVSFFIPFPFSFVKSASLVCPVYLAGGIFWMVVACCSPTGHCVCHWAPLLFSFAFSLVPASSLVANVFCSRRRKAIFF